MAWIPDPNKALTIIKRLETGEDFLASSMELFLTFFNESHSPEQFSKRMAQVGSLLAQGTGHYVDPEIAAAMDSAIHDPDTGVRLVVDRLHGLAPLFDVPHKTVELGDNSFLEAAICYHATLLVRAMRQSSVGEKPYGYGDHVAPAHHELDRLWLRYGEAHSVTLLTIRSLSERVGAELAFQSGDYVTALRAITHSIKAFVESEEQTQAIGFAWEGRLDCPPWLDGAEDRAKDYLAHLRTSREGNVDWAAVIASCNTLKSFLPEAWIRQEGIDDSLDEETDYWDETIGWAKAQLTPSQLRSLIEDRAGAAANLRLSNYFLADNLWQRLSEDARNGLVTADLVWMDDGPESRLRTILNPLQRATEDVLYHHLWVPLAKWGLPRDSEYLAGLLARKQYPGLTEYIQLVSEKLAKRYFRGLGIEGDDLDFLTNKAQQHFRSLRDARNRVEHEPHSGVSPNDIRTLYRASLGIGCRGILPELVRLLNNIHNSEHDTAQKA